MNWCHSNEDWSLFSRTHCHYTNDRTNSEDQIQSLYEPFQHIPIPRLLKNLHVNPKDGSNTTWCRMWWRQNRACSLTSPKSPIQTSAHAWDTARTRSVHLDDVNCFRSDVLLFTSLLYLHMVYYSAIELGHTLLDVLFCTCSADRIYIYINI